MTGPSFVPLPGSERAPLPGAEIIGPVDPGQRIEVTLITRRRAELPPEVVTGPAVLSREELAARHGTDPADLGLIREVLARYGIGVTGADQGGRRVHAAGPASAMAAAFGATLQMARSPHAAAAGFRDITTGDNGAYQAGPGWDACSGLGAPDGTALLARLGDLRRRRRAPRPAAGPGPGGRPRSWRRQRGAVSRADRGRPARPSRRAAARP